MNVFYEQIDNENYVEIVLSPKEAQELLNQKMYFDELKINKTLFNFSVRMELKEDIYDEESWEI